MLRLLAALLLLFAGPAAAHSVNLATTDIRIDGPVVTVDLGIFGTDTGKMAGTVINNLAFDMVDPALLAANADKVTAYIQARSAVVDGAGTACPRIDWSMEADSDGGILTRSRFDCAAAEGPLAYRSTVMPSVSPAAREAVVLQAPEGRRELGLLDSERTTVALTEPAPPGTVELAGQYLLMGVEHIFIGYDHIAFLIAVLLWARRIGPLVKIVTAFTAAHSITLTLAVLDIVPLDPGLVEILVAATIVLVAAENYLSRSLDRRWTRTFALGLVHGFGFAGILQEIGLPSEGLAVALGAFNIGVEIGQLAIVALAVPLLLAGDRLFARAGARPERSAALVYGVSAVIMALGVYWLAERTVFA
ncbi:MAG TPA: HupE/UreJ family protein [Alphaproteobacteria bacterium]|nr:HupE/UreJ family protein [Alphaproteobacteria bacterium]